MGKDFYAVLGVSADASDIQVKQAYRRQALQWHPSRHEKQGKEEAQKQLDEVTEAFLVLTNEAARKAYDAAGEKGLKAESEGKDWNLSRAALDVFGEFFGTNNPFPSLSAEQAIKSQTTTKTEPLSVNVYCSLEEIYSGCSKKIKASRKKLNASHTAVSEEAKIFTIEVQPGWKAGTVVTFAGEGDESLSAEAGDLSFTLREKPHPRFRRDGQNLVYTASISLLQALSGTVVNVETLDGRVLPIPVPAISKISDVVTVPKEGLPSLKAGSSRGDLVIEFNVRFPGVLSENQKQQLAKILPA